MRIARGRGLCPQLRRACAPSSTQAVDEEEKITCDTLGARRVDEGPRRRYVSEDDGNIVSMTQWIIASITFVLGLSIGALFALWRQRSSESDSPLRLAQAEAHLQANQQQLQDYRARLAHAETTVTQLSALRERELREQAALTQKQQQADGRILEALAPVAQNLTALQERLTKLEEQRHQQFGNLSQQMDASQQLGQQLQRVTQSLEGALRSGATRGAWGEAQLRNIVEAAGLLENVDFLTQTTVEADGSQLRPDLIIRLPDGKSIPVDAKVPFDSYIKAQELAGASAPDQVAARSGFLAEHVRAVRKHVDDLARKDYGRWVPGSPDLTVAFLPSEALLSAALDADPGLLDYAFRQRVALTSPVSLWSVLKTISFAWQQDSLSVEANEVFELARELHQRIVRIGNLTVKMGDQLEAAVKTYNQFVGSLETRVLVTGRKLQRVDQDALIPQSSPIETRPRYPVAPELLETEKTTQKSADQHLCCDPARSEPPFAPGQ